MELPLTNGKTTLIDESDFAEVSQFKWYAHRPGKGKVYYAVRNIKRPGKKPTMQMLHRFLLEVTVRSIYVDHVNGDGLDNRRDNLRLSSSKENQRNRSGAQSSSRTGIKGVGYDKRKGLFRARIKIAGKEIFLGYFKDVTSASAAYETRARLEFKEFYRNSRSA